MHVQLAKATAEGLVCVLVQILIPEHEHHTLEKKLVNRLEVGFAQPGEIEAGDFRAESGGEGFMVPHERMMPGTGRGRDRPDIAEPMPCWVGITAGRRGLCRFRPSAPLPGKR